ncbi:MAG: pyrroline-5-carboxylate reductase [Hyphomicrobiales bacterium]
MATLSGRLVLIGAGKMGGAMLDGWLRQGIPGSQIAIIDPAPSQELLETTQRHEIALNTDIGAITDADVVLIAVKPQVMDAVLPEIISLGKNRPVFLSVAAGRTIEGFEAAFGKDAAIVRAMPNTPAAVGRSITAICPNSKCTPQQVELATGLLQAIGETVHIEDESLMDAVTAVSGSGPAYVFHLIECMAAAGEKEGLPRETAMQLARATVAGAGELVHQSELPAATLRENVTSPGGTTAAALEVLMAEDAMPKILAEGIRAATKRGKELAG